MLSRLSRFLAWLDGRLRRDCCRRRGHAYDFRFTDICTVGGDAFYPAVWCGRCRLYVPNPRVRVYNAPPNC